MMDVSLQLILTQICVCYCIGCVETIAGAGNGSYQKNAPGWHATETVYNPNNIPTNPYNPYNHNNQLNIPNKPNNPYVPNNPHKFNIIFRITLVTRITLITIINPIYHL